jgi:hypothetical protein
MLGKKFLKFRGIFPAELFRCLALPTSIKAFMKVQLRLSPFLSECKLRILENRVLRGLLWPSGELGKWRIKKIT